MRIQFATDQLTALFITGQADGCIPASMTGAFFEAMAIVAAAVDEHDVLALALAYAAPQRKDCILLHLQGNLYLLTRFFRDENGLCAELVDVVIQP